jgi:DNA-binding response OmpR family regulator
MTGLSKIALVVGVDAPLGVKLARWLAGFGIDSVHVGDTEGGLALSASINPDLIILADQAGGPELLDFLVQTAARPGRRATRVMLCARERNVALLGAAVAEGAAECLVAPFDADLLKFKLEQTGVLAVQ